MKALKMTLGALTVLALAISAGCQSTPPKAQIQKVDTLGVAYYRVQLNDQKAPDVDWALVNQDLSGDAGIGSGIWKKLVGDKPADPLKVIGYTKVSRDTRQTVMLDQAVSAERLIDALSKQGTVSLIHESKSTNVAVPENMKGAKLQENATITKAFIPQKQCENTGTRPGATAVSLAPGFWTADYLFTYTPMRVVGDLTLLNFQAEFSTQTKIPDCSNPGQMESHRDLTTEIQQVIFLDKDSSVVLSGIRNSGIDKSLVHSEAGKAGADAAASANEVVLMVLRPKIG